MTIYSLHKKKYSLVKKLCFFLCIVSVGLFFGCKKSFDYFPYVSELRNNVLLAEADGFSLRMYAVYRENPYLPDGIPRECNTRTEIHLTAPGMENTDVSDVSTKIFAVRCQFPQRI